SGLGQVCVWVRLIATDRDLASALGAEWHYVDAGAAADDQALDPPNSSAVPSIRARAEINDYLPLAVLPLNAQQTADLVENLQSDRRTSILSAPKVTLFNGQQASLIDCTQRPFVVGAHSTQPGEGNQPKIAVIEEGLKLVLRATQSPTAARIQLDANLRLTQLDTVHTATTLVEGQPATVQLPRLKRWRIDLAVEVPDQESLLVACVPSYERRQFLYFLLTATNLWATPGD
ncbi:MAG: hypothetical protein JNG90_06455, partial [Planctomycetaceae bacterium]|nr:hypothetical protein [Planctomycetaceae bacterium]